MAGYSLGDYFPEKSKKEFAENVIELGSVIRKHVDNTNPPKIKFFIVVGISEKSLSIASVYINTEINVNVNHNTYLKSFQHEITASNYDFLDWDSTVDCARIIEYELDSLKRSIQLDPSIFVGSIKNSCFTQIHQKCTSSKIISPELKSRYNLK